MRARCCRYIYVYYRGVGRVYIANNEQYNPVYIGVFAALRATRWINRERERPSSLYIYTYKYSSWIYRGSCTARTIDDKTSRVASIYTANLCRQCAAITPQTFIVFWSAPSRAYFMVKIIFKLNYICGGISYTELRFKLLWNVFCEMRQLYEHTHSL